jgi:hypothetical protein
VFWLSDTFFHKRQIPTVGRFMSCNPAQPI